MSVSAGIRVPGTLKLQSWWIVALAGALPLLSYPFAWNYFLPYRFQLHAPVEVIYLIGALAILVVQLQKAGGVRLPRTPIDIAVLAVLGIGAIATVLSNNVYVSVPALIHLVANVSVLYIISVSFDRRCSRALIVCWLCAATAEALYGLFQAFLSVWLQWHGSVAAGNSPDAGLWTTLLSQIWNQGGVTVGTIGNKDWLAGYLTVSLLVCFPLWTTGRRIGRRLRWVAPCYAVILVTLAICHSSGAWLGFGVAVLVCVFRILWEKRQLLAILVIGAVLVNAAAISILNVSHLEKVWNENVRPPIWKGVLIMIADSHALIGTGLGTFTYEYAQYRPPEYFRRPQATNLTDHAHNEFLEVTAESGIFGLGALCWLLGIVCRQAWRGSRRNAPERWMVLASWAGLIALLVHNQFDINLRLPPNETLFWLLMGLVIRGAHRATPAPAPFPAVRHGVDDRRMIEAVAPPSPRVQRIRRLAMAGGALVVGAGMAYSQVYKPVAADLAFRGALLARDRGDRKEAIRDYERCLKRDPTRMDVKFMLAYRYALSPSVADKEKAIHHYEEIIQVAPDYGDVNSNVAYVLWQCGRKSEAIPYMQRAVERNPENLALRTDLAHLYLELGRNFESDLKPEIFEILRLEPTNTWANEVWEQKFKQEKPGTPVVPPARKRKPMRANPSSYLTY